MIVSKKLRNETLLMLALLVTACGGGSTPPSAEPETSGVAEPRPDIYAEFVLSTDLSHLSENQRRMIGVLIEASEIMDDLFWRQAWGDDYLSFNDGRLNGGVRKSSEPVPATGVLLVFYSDNLERDVGRVQELGGAISQEIFSFPGGRRFHFTDPTGTEFAIWSEVSE